MTWLRWFVREWMIGWHQGHAERAEATAQRHRAAEQHWKAKPDPRGRAGRIFTAQRP